MNRRSILILGAGKVGRLIAVLLSRAGHYDIHLATRDTTAAAALFEELDLGEVHSHRVDASRAADLERLMTLQRFDAVVSALPYHLNPTVVDLANTHAINYFDLTEDICVTRYIRETCAATDTVFMPQCGLAPGFINIVANEVMSQFETLDTVKLRVGALPQHSANPLKYALNWSTEGLINEYLNPCEAIENGKLCKLQPLEGLESLVLDGIPFEAFNTSGGLGTLAINYAGKVQTMNYKTLRYPGHAQAFKLLLDGLKLSDDRDTLKDVLEKAIPSARQDVVVICVLANGRQSEDFIEESYFKKIYPWEIGGKTWSAIQVATAAGLCGALDTVLADVDRYSGFVPQEAISLSQFMDTTFGQYYA